MRLLYLTCCLSLTAAAGCGGNAFQAGSGGAGDGGGTPGDATMGEAALDGGSSWCASHPVMFCEDFDEYSSIDDLLASPRWSDHSVDAGSFHLTATTSPPSAPNSLEAIGSDGAAVLLVKTFDPLAPSVAHARLEFDLRIDSAGMPGLLSAAGFAAIGFGSGIDDGYVALVIGEGPQLAMAWGISGDAGIRSDAGASGITHVMTFPAAGRWSDRFAIDIDYTRSCVQVFDGTSSQLTPPCIPLPPELLGRRTLSIVLGDYVVGFGSVGQIDLEFDDVTFDAK